MTDGKLALRPAQHDDHALVARLFLEMRTGDDPPSVQRWRDYALDQWVVAELDGHPVGYMWFEVLAAEGHVRQIVVDPAFQRRGVARTLMLEGARRTREAGLTHWSLNVIPTNTPAVKLYEQLGMRFTFASASFRFDWSLVDALPAPVSGLACAELAATDHATFEHSFGLPPGLLAKRAAMPSVLLMGLRDPDDPADPVVGLAAFDRDFPGCYPFRARTPAHAVTLLKGLRPHATKTQMGLVVEKDPELDRHLGELGARVQLRFVHFRGPLPTA